MPLVTASVLTTVGLSLITGAIKYYKENSLEGTTAKAVLEAFDGLFGEILGGVCSEGYNHVRQRLESLNVPEHNADIERCSRHALLKALITFSEASKHHLPQTTLSAKEQEICQHFLEEAQKHMATQLKLLTTLGENNPVLYLNPLTEGDAMAQALAKDQSRERIDAMKSGLTDFALREFSYLPGNLLHKQLLNWLPEGLPNGRHWFVYYVHELHANLKKDEPPYFKNARRILTQKQLADINLLTKQNLAKLDRLMTLTEEVHDTVLRVEDRLIYGLNKVNQKLDFLIYNSSPNTFSQYEKYVSQLKKLNEEFEDEQQELADLLADFSDDGSDQAERTKRRINRVEKRRSDIDLERQNIRQEIADIERAAMDFVNKLTPKPGTEKESEFLEEARAYIEIGDFAGANEALSESRINAMITRASELQQGIDAINQQVAQALMAKVDAITALRKENWLADAIGFCELAVKTYTDYEILRQAAYFLQDYNQFENAIALYYQALQLDINDEQKAPLYNNLAILLAKYSDQQALAKQYYEEALTIYRRLAQKNPSVYEPRVADALNNLAVLLAKHPDQQALAKQYHEEALTIYRRLAQENPPVYESYMAFILNNLAVLLAKHPDQQALAKQYHEEALTIYRRLAQEKPSVYEPDMADALHNLAILLEEYSDQQALAKQYHEEALTIYRRLAQEKPSVYEPDVANALNNLAILLEEYSDQQALAKQYHEEALTIYRRLAQKNPSVYEPDVADALFNLAILLAKHPDQHALAKQYYEEALSIRRRLAQKNPSVYEPRVADALHNLAVLLAKHPDQHALAIQYYEEALSIRRRLAQEII